MTKKVIEILLPSASYSLLNEPQWFRERIRIQAKNNGIDAVTGFITWIRDISALFNLIHISHIIHLLFSFSGGFAVVNSNAIMFQS